MIYDKFDLDVVALIYIILYYITLIHESFPILSHLVICYC